MTAPSNPDPPESFWSSRRWLARLSFSFLIIAIVLVYRGYRGAQSHDLSRGLVLLCYVAGMVAFVLFLMGTREKHRRPQD